MRQEHTYRPNSKNNSIRSVFPTGLHCYPKPHCLIADITQAWQAKLQKCPRPTHTQICLPVIPKSVNMMR